MTHWRSQKGKPMSITIKQLQAKVDMINNITNAPSEAYTRLEDGSLFANEGHYHISQAYSGYMLQKICNSSGGVSCPCGLGHVTKKELSHQLNGFIAGLQTR
jgi:hypothetical protein